MTEDMNRSRLSSAIEATLKAWLASGKAVSAAEVNSGAAPGGCCSDFAKAVISCLGGSDEADAMDVMLLGLDNLQVVDPDDRIGRPFDRLLLERGWPEIRPPGSLSWDDLDQLSEDASFSGLTHTWLTKGRRHYDAEAPDGVENLFDLPFFQRAVASWIVERRPGLFMG